MVQTEVDRLHKETLVLDALSFPYILEDQYLPAVKAGGVDAAFITVAISQNFRETVKEINRIKKAIADKQETFSLSLTAADIRQAKKDGKIAILMGFQDIEPIEDDLSFIETFHTLGVRIMQLTYTGSSRAGDGCGERIDGGLRYFGLEAIEEMNRTGILIDLSHTGDASTDEALQHSKEPVLFTHTNCRTLCDNKRNKTDSQIRAMADTGGCMGLTPHPALVVRGRAPNLEDFLDQIDYAVKIAGIESVGIGLDYIEGLKSGTAIPPSVRTWRTRRPDIFGTVDDFFHTSFTAGLESIDTLSALTGGLVRRGCSSAFVEKILGGNFLRVLDEVVG
jgi:membrane dipeptidase